ncbi:arginase [Xylariaceae sp. FL0016]|nr:arginase [Xylariaceae sp. FL0016]
MRWHIDSFILLALGSQAWELPAPPGQTRLFNAIDDSDVHIISGSQVNGLTTYGGLPFVNCLSDQHDENDKYDIAILGAPFDIGVTARPGARYGPRGIRVGSERIQPDFAWDPCTGKNPFKSWATIVDCGDAALTPLDKNAALAQLDRAYRVVSGKRASNESQSMTPRIVMLGGDHTITLSALRSTYKRWGKVSMLHFDSHIDTWDPTVLGGGISDYAGLNHGTFLHIAHEEGLISNTSLHAGIRAPLARRKGDTRNDLRCGFATLMARDLDRLGTAGLVSAILQRLGGGKVYVSVDIDVLDPAYAPATGTPEPGGWTTRELLTILDGLRDAGLEVVGGDVVEVSPIYDTRGETTALAAAHVALALIDMMVETPVKSLADE